MPRVPSSRHRDECGALNALRDRWQACWQADPAAHVAGIARAVRPHRDPPPATAPGLAPASLEPGEAAALGGTVRLLVPEHLVEWHDARRLLVGPAHAALLLRLATVPGLVPGWLWRSSRRTRAPGATCALLGFAYLAAPEAGGGGALFLHLPPTEAPVRDALVAGAVHEAAPTGGGAGAVRLVWPAGMDAAGARAAARLGCRVLRFRRRWEELRGARWVARPGTAPVPPSTPDAPLLVVRPWRGPGHPLPGAGPPSCLAAHEPAAVPGILRPDSTALRVVPVPAADAGALREAAALAARRVLPAFLSRTKKEKRPSSPPPLTGTSCRTHRRTPRRWSG